MKEEAPMDYSTFKDEELAAMLRQRATQGGGVAVAENPAEPLALLYDRYFRQCFALAVRMLADAGRAEEVVQEVFLKLWQAPQGFDQTRGKFASWLLSVVHHRCIDEIRKNKRNLTISHSFGPDGEEGDDPINRIPDEHSGPEELSWLNQQRGAVRQALTRLTDVQRRVIELAYFGGMTQAEIAAHLGEPLGTVKTRIRLGLQKMKAMLEAEGLEVV